MSAWDHYEENRAKHEAEGLSPHMARIRAEQEVRNWRRLVPDERAWLESLAPPAPGDGGGREVWCSLVQGRRDRWETGEME